jgi:hypothetical protein
VDSELYFEIPGRYFHVDSEREGRKRGFLYHVNMIPEPKTSKV